MDTNDISRARVIAEIAHAGQKYDGEPYFTAHVMKVVVRVKSDRWATNDHVAVAYLHDVVEDTVTTISDLIELGFSDAVVKGVATITRDEGVPYFEYIASIAEADSDNLAYLVKYHDLQENLENSRGTPRAKGYEEALKILREAREQ